MRKSPGAICWPRDNDPGVLRSSLQWLRLRYLDYRPRPDDIFLVAYPRSGCIWLQQIVAGLYACQAGGASTSINWFEQIVDGNTIERLPAPRVFRSHLRYQDSLYSIPKGPVRYIYLIRDGRDVLRSYYRFAVQQLGYTGNFDRFFRLFMRGRLPYGSWFDHVAGWWQKRAAENFLMLNYEDLVHDLPGAVRRIAHFCDLDADPDCLPELLDRCRFAKIKNQEESYGVRPRLANLDPGLQPAVGEMAVTLHSDQEAIFCRELERRFGRSVYDPGILLGAPRVSDELKRKFALPKKGI